jgi:hypothetical protein
MGDFDVVAIAAVLKMQQQVDVFKRIADEEDGDAARVAHDAAKAGASAIKAAGQFRDALVKNRVAEANGALVTFQSSITDLEHAAKEWRQL